jgi:hypothetical protein
MLPAIPESVRIARFHVRAALGYCELDRLADDAAIITSELVTNAVQHARCDVTEMVGVTLGRASGSEAVIIAVSEPYAPPKAVAADGNGVSPPGKSGNWPPSSAYPPGSSRHSARTAAASRQPGSPAWHAEPLITAGEETDARRRLRVR